VNANGAIHAMQNTIDKLAKEIHELPDVEKLRLVDAILTDLDKTDPELERFWVENACKRWAAYRAGKVLTVIYESVREKRERSC